MAERLLHHDPGALAEQLRACEALHDRREQRRRYLQVEDGGVGLAQRGGEARIGVLRPEVTAEVGHPRGEAVKHALVERLAAGFDRFARVLAQPLGAPVIHRHAHDGAAQQPAPLQAVQRAEGHLLRQVACDPEDDEGVRRGMAARSGHLRTAC